MADDTMTAIEKVFDAKQETLTEMIRQLQKAVERLETSVQKVLDDHENRLRQQSEMDMRQQNEIAELKATVSRNCGWVEEHKRLHDETRREEKAEGQANLTHWQQIAVRLAEIAVVALFGGGAAGAVIRLLADVWLIK